MTQGPGPQYGGNPPPEGWVPPNMPWPGAGAPTPPPNQANHHGAYQQPAWPPGPQQFAHPGSPPRRNRKPLVIGLSAAVLLVIIAVVSIVVFRGGDTSKSSADAAVRGYLEALAKGDATTALSYSKDKPADTKFLTNEILQKQIAKWPITDIKILSTDGALRYGRVHVSAKFGDKTSDEEIVAKKTGKEWMIEHAAIKLDPTNAILNSEAMKTLTVFGQPMGNSPVYVFPGWVDLGSTNHNLQAEPKNPFLLKELDRGSAHLSDVEFTLSPKGEKAVRQAVNAKLADCAASNELSPRDCPQRVYEHNLVDGTATWGTPDTGKLKTEFRSHSLQASISGEVVFPLTARTRSGEEWRGTDTGSVYWTADVSKDTVTISGR